MTDEEKNKERLKQQYVGYGHPVEARFRPRVWDGKQYYYPKFSELGITYESDKGDEMSLAYAFGWLIYTDRYKDAVCFKHILEACTGLRDKNGKLIYEGDIVKYHFGKNSFGVFDVVYDEKYAVYILQRGGIHCYDLALSCVKCKVVGNIHERIEK